MRLLPLALLAVALTGCSSSDEATDSGPIPFDYPKDGDLRANHIQLKATHNSYHVAQPNMTVDALKYSEKPLDVQVSKQGVRGFELDTQYVLANDDFEVSHIAVIDDDTTCRKLVDCLSALRAWSKKNPAHHVLMVQIEPKDTTLPADAEGYFQKLENEILSVWPRDSILTPDDVQGNAATLREAIVSGGWPTLGETRQKILFFIDNAGSWRDGYTHGNKDLTGRLMFVNSSPGADYEAFYVLNDPVADGAQISDVLSQNFMVRTRADADNVEPFQGDTSRQTAALASGAQVVSTDYPAPVDGVSYVTELPGGTPSRCNPITAPSDCASEDIEDPKFIR
jgi:Phosphoinositide phospholipase C, Ca2+-dependent